MTDSFSIAKRENDNLKVQYETLTKYKEEDHERFEEEIRDLQDQIREYEEEVINQ